jgi:hypothetical protein
MAAMLFEAWYSADGIRFRVADGRRATIDPTISRRRP